jgi:Penicillin binding protein transpeptidase domain/NTF2-like N-terminal transpeptidase domain
MRPVTRHAAVHPARPRRRRRRWIIAVTVAVVVVVLVAAAAVGYDVLLRTKGSPSQTAAAYLAGWQRGSYAAMDKVSVNVPRSGLAGPLRQVDAQAGIRHIRLAPGRVTTQGGSAQERFTATADLASGHTWTWRGQLRLVRRDRRWWVNWSPSAIYPGLRAGQRFVLTGAWPARAPVLADDGTVLSSPQAFGESGSISLLVGNVVQATAAQAKALGAPYRPGDMIGQGGIEQAYQAELAGRPSLIIRIEGPGRQLDATAARFAATPGTPVKTSLNLRYQVAASQAVSSAATKKPVDVVAIQPSTGRVLAVVERPGGFDRALQGVFPPGSTFKVVTASALANSGLRPSSTVQCPSQVNIGGRVFHNDDNEKLGTTSLLNAFAVSCNSTFALLATQRLNGPALASMAEAFGFNAKPALGIPATLGQFTTPHQPVDLAADAFGQGTDLVNPLSQASVVAAIEDGTWRPPQLVISPAPRQTAQPRSVSPAILDTLRPMMRAVVTSGTAAGVGFPPGVYGKTGTAQYGNGPNPPSHGWFIGYQGDLAFAVLVEGGGLGADSAGPIANAFLRKL